MEDDYRDYRNYRDDYRNYRDDDYRSYRRNYRDYDMRGGRRNYRSQDYYEELEMVVDDIREHYRTLEDISEMANNQQEKNMIMKVAQAEKENYHQLKQLMNKSM